MSSIPGLLSVKGLQRRFREGDRIREVLKGVDLEVAEGECIALLGRSGSGKSTLLNLISGIDQPTEGEIHINGVNLTTLGDRGRTLFRRRHIGFIYQFFNLIPTLTVEENLLLPLELNQFSRKDARRKALTILEELSLLDRCTSYPDRLSGGEQQRVAIARALVHDPSLILADEPTGNLDEDTGSAILSILERMLRKAGKTIIVVTHSKQVSRMADRIVTLNHGQITQQDAESL